MDKDKISYTIACIKEVYKLSDGAANLIEANIIERIKLYQHSFPYVDASNDCNSMYAFKPQNKKYTLTDFFLNRLLFNIREYDMNCDVTVHKGAFTPILKTFEIASTKDLKKETSEVLEPYTQDKNIINKSTVKVFNHEIGHALQSKYSSGLEVPSLSNSTEKNNNYINVIKLLKNKYPTINIQEEKGYSDYITGGLRFADGNSNGNKCDKDKSYCKRYQPSNVLDEIMNEEEALNITGCINVQRKKQYGNNGDYRNIYNYESSNCYITCYAKMIKSLIGYKIFDYMYLNSEGLINRFEEYRDLVNNIIVRIPDEMPALAGIIDRLEKIKGLKNNNIECTNMCMNMDLFFAKCLERFINKYIERIPIISNETYQIIISHINEMQSSMLTNDDINKRNELEQHKILNNLRLKLQEYNDNYNLQQNNENKKITI